ncbi:705d0359-93b2-4826-8ff3-39780867150d [Sclerotinia trifoliorum]|uniref:Ribosome assembly protein 4 n=1 Tax=Sclerotinia trifoliorum TaxID=28548 RepID=A0A8H2ZQU0_9HELO|nr:705d0359-93b2-4826-8ff3-39780867150d [Sclerotinia trifoliorum]
MATVPPPPSKRQKTDALMKARAQQEIEEIPADAGNLLIQFVNRITGEPIGEGPIFVPVANTDRKSLNLLVNKLMDSSENISYTYDIEISEKGAKEKKIIPLPADVYHTLMAPGTVREEGQVNWGVAPEAVFRVQAVSRCASTIPGHDKAILATQFSPRSSSRMASGSGDNTARIWDCDTGTPVHTLKGHTSWVLAVSWSPDESRLATGSYDSTVRMWDPKTGKQCGNPMKGHTNWVTSLAWEPYHVQKPGEPRLASASKDATVRVWSTNQQKIELVLSGHKGSVSCVKWGGTGFIYTASHDKTVKVWNAKDGTLAHSLNSHAHWVNHLALSTEFVMRTAYHDHTGKIPATDEEKVKKAKERFLKASEIKGEIVERLVSASDDFTMYLWDPAKQKKPVAQMLGHQKQVNHVAFSPDGRLIASSGFDNHTKIWNARDGKFISTLLGHVGPVYQCAFSPDSRLLVTAGKDTTLKVWDMRTYKLAKDLPGHIDEVWAVDWSPDGEKVGSGGKDKAVRIWRH